MDTTAAAELLMVGGGAAGPPDHAGPPYWADEEQQAGWEEEHGDPVHERYHGFGMQGQGQGLAAGRVGRSLGPSGPGPPLKRMRGEQMEAAEYRFQAPGLGGYGRESVYLEGGGFGAPGMGMHQRLPNGILQGGGQGFGAAGFSPSPGPAAAPVLGADAGLGGGQRGAGGGGGGRGRGMGSIFFKTKLCARFRAGNCPYNTNCNFAHGMEELRKPPRGWEEMVANQEAGAAPPPAATPAPGQASNQPSQQTDAQKFHKTRPCKKYYSEGGCPYGDRCNFLHDEQGRAARETSTSGPLSPGGASSGSGGVAARPPNWKTRLCNKWDVTGHCPFGDKCHFAHGTAELQSYGGGPFDSSNGGSGGGTPTEVKSSTKQWEVGMTDSQPAGTSQGIASKQARNGVRGGVHERTDAPWKESLNDISTVYGDWIEDDQIKLWNDSEQLYPHRRPELGYDLLDGRDKGDGGQDYGPEADSYLKADGSQVFSSQRRMSVQHNGFQGLGNGGGLQVHSQLDFGYYGQEGSNYDGP